MNYGRCRLTLMMLLFVGTHLAHATSDLEYQGFKGNINFQGVIQEAGCTLDFDSDEQLIMIGESNSREIFHEVPNSLVIHLTNCERRDNNAFDDTNELKTTWSGGTLMTITLDGETLPDDPTVFMLHPRESHMGLKILDDDSNQILPDIHSHVIRTDKGGNHIRLSTQVVRGEGVDHYRGPLTGTLTFHLKYY